MLGNTELTNHVAPQLVELRRLFKVPGSAKLLSALLSTRVFRHSSRGFGGCFGDPEFMEGDFFDACLQPIVDDAKGARDVFTRVDLETTHRFEAMHARLESPCLLIWGAEDPFFPLEGARRMLSELPKGSRLEVLEDAKLFVHEEYPERFVDLAEPFMRAALEG